MHASNASTMSGLSIFPPEVLGDILVFLPTTTVYNLWLSGDKTLWNRIRAPGAVRYFGLDWNLLIKPVQHSLPPFVLQLPYLQHLSLTLNYSFRQKPVIGGLDFKMLPQTMKTLKLDAHEIISVWKRQTDEGFVFGRHFESLEHLDIRSNGQMIPQLFKTLPDGLVSFCLKMTRRSASFEDIALLPRNLRQLRLEDTSSLLYEDIEVKPDFPENIEHLFLGVDWSWFCSSFPPHLVSLYSKQLHRGIRSFEKIKFPPGLKYLGVQTNRPLSDDLIPLLPRSLEYLIWPQGHLTPNGLSLLPPNLKFYQFNSIDPSWRLPNQLEFIGMDHSPLKQHLPNSLTSVNVATLFAHQTPFLPSNLLGLWVAQDIGPDVFSQLPSRLQRLSLRDISTITLWDLESLPKTLTALSVQLVHTVIWNADHLPKGLTELNLLAHIHEIGVRSLAKLSSLKILDLVNRGSSTDVNASTFPYLPKGLLDLSMPMRGYMKGSDLLELPPELTNLNLSSFAPDLASTHLTPEDFQKYWPRSLVTAILPTLLDPVPSMEILSSILPPCLQSICHGSSRSKLYMKLPSAQQKVCWEDATFVPNEFFKWQKNSSVSSDTDAISLLLGSELDLVM